MDSNEKRSKRPRIGQPRLSPENTEMREYERSESQPQKSYDRNQYQRRPQGYNNQNRYNNYNQYGNNRYNNYQRNNNFDNNPENAPAEGEEPRQSYQPRNNQGYRRYDNNREQHGGYNQNRNRQGGYNNQNRQGGYNNQNRQGGYNNQNRQGGYNNQNRQGGYNNRNNQGGYNNRNRQGGYNNQNQNRVRHNEFGMPHGGKSFVPRPKPVEYEQSIPDPNEQIRLNKFMANSGICSRREADEFIQQGLVKVNGKVVTELGTKITHSDTVEYDEKVVALERKTYILLNKPKDCVTTADDPNGRLTVMDLVKNACTERIYPVGRLDRNTTGVLLLTNDGDLASKLTHPKYVKKKIYHVWTDKDISEDDMQAIADGIELEDGEIHADAISYATDTDRNQAGIEIHSGRNRIVRRIFEHLGYHVTKLDRVYFAGLTKKNLPRGRWRYLTQEEVNYLKMGSFE
ncbi:MAG: RNA-binding S4 domain-containing protein [Bacteroides sp.]|nr:RNA-binding S4 domain-containing protein [Bacteroides sp.]MCM1413302.1 RNA-binding S4 domain-containing protein [Bacteroides sp.]MCM1471388.1 RNA-binding S4 domain-containing protein [Bacteroides sp.]